MNVRRGCLNALMVSTVLIGGTAAVSQQIPKRDRRCLPPSISLDVHEVTDGDTIVADILMPWDVSLRNQSIRCIGYDAWETSKRRRSVNVTDAEIEKGKDATAALSGLIAAADAVYAVAGKKDSRGPYGRALCKLYVVHDGRMLDVAEWMEDNGHVRQPNAKTRNKYR